jgi:hypothetical protein
MRAILSWCGGVARKFNKVAKVGAFAKRLLASRRYVVTFSSNFSKCRCFAENGVLSKVVVIHGLGNSGVIGLLCLTLEA